MIKHNFIVYRRTSSALSSGAPGGHVVQAVAQFVNSLLSPEVEQNELVPQSLNASSPHRELLKKGIRSYLLPGQKGFELVDISALPSAFEKLVSPDVLKVGMTYNVHFSWKSPFTF